MVYFVTWNNVGLMQTILNSISFESSQHNLAGQYTHFTPLTGSKENVQGKDYHLKKS